MSKSKTGSIPRGVFSNAMLAEAVELWLEAVGAKEITRRLKLGGSVQPLQLARA